MTESVNAAAVAASGPAGAAASPAPAPGAGATAESGTVRAVSEAASVDELEGDELNPRSAWRAGASCSTWWCWWATCFPRILP